VIPNRRPSRVVVTLTAVAICVLSVALLLASRGWIDPPGNASARRAPTPGASGEYVPGAADAGAKRSASGEDRQVFGITLPTPDDRRVSDDEPAGLPAPPNGERLMRRTVPFKGGRLESSVWRIADGDAARWASFYQRAAEGKGFRLIRRTVDGDSGAHRLRMRRDGQWLQVDCRPARDGVRIVVQLR